MTPPTTTGIPTTHHVRRLVLALSVAQDGPTQALRAQVAEALTEAFGPALEAAADHHTEVVPELTLDLGVLTGPTAAAQA